jgi:RNA polymerase sigma-70 factor (ECF subfamily)
MRYTNSDLDARALFNNGFLKICQNLDKYKIEIPFHVWAKRVLINSIIDEYRKNKRYRDIITTKEHDFELERNSTSSNNEALKDHETENAAFLLRELPEMTRKVLNLYIFDGYNHREIGEILKISENTSRWHLHNRKTRLKTLLENKAPKKSLSVAI